MPALASEDNAENVSLLVLDAYPRDVIIQYVYRPTLVDRPILYILFQVS